MRQLLALVLIVLIVAPLIAATMGLLSVNSWILDRDFYVNALSNEALYEAVLTDELPRQINARVLTQVDSIPVSALSAALRTVVTGDYLREQAVTNTNTFFDYVEGRAPAAALYLDLQPIKAQIAGDAGPRFARALAENLPLCAAGQEAVAPGGSVMRCVPSDVTVEAAAAQIEDGLPRLLETTPDRIQLGDTVDLQGANWFFDLTLRSQLNRAIGVLVVVSLVAWLVVGLIAGDTTRDRLIWLGVGLLVPAVPAALIGAGFIAASRADVISTSLRVSSTYSPAFEQAVLNVISPAMNLSGGTLLGLGAALTVIGLILVIVASQMGRSSRPTGPTVEIVSREKPKREGF